MNAQIADAHAGQKSAAVTGPGADRLQRLAARVIAAERWLAPVCALILLLAPNPLVWPSAVVGVLPTLARLVTTRRLWRATPFDWPLLLLVVGALLGGWASLSRDGAWIRLTGLLAALLLFVALREHVTTESAFKRTVLGLLAPTVAGSALLLVLVGPFLLLDHVPLVAAIVAVIDRWGLGAWVVDQDWLLQRYRFRASGVGALADVGLALAFAALLGVRSWTGRVLTLLSIPFFAVVLIVSDSRGSMLAAALTLGAMATVWRRRLLWLIPVGALGFVALMALGPVDRGLSLKTLAQRFWFWENSLYLAREVPLTGAGLGLESVQLVYRGYFQPAYPPFSHAHSIYLQGLLEYGVFGLLGLLGLGLATLWAGWRSPPGGVDWSTAARLAGFGVGMAMLTAGLTEIQLLTTLGGVIALAGCGLLAATTSSQAASVSRQQHARPSAARIAPLVSRGAVLGGAVAGLLLLGAGLWVSGLGARVGARLALNAGNAELNRATFSESIRREERGPALDRAVSMLRLASSLDETDPVIQRSLALALAANDDSRRARAAADRAKGLTPPSDRQELFQLGRAYVAISAWGEAVRAWQAAEAAPQLLQLGNRLIRARNMDQAINAFSAAAQIEPSGRGAYEGIARAGAERGKSVEETIEDLQPLMEHGSGTEYGALLQAARVYRDGGHYREANVALSRAEQIKSDPDLSFELGRLRLRIGRAEITVPLFQRAAADLPYDPDNWLWLARAQSRNGQDEAAVATVKQALSRLDTSGQFASPAEKLPETAAVRATEIKRAERAPLLGVMAESLIRLRRAEEALPAIDEAVAALPKDPWLLATREEALAVARGAAPNLVRNPAFEWDDAWVLREREWWATPEPDTVVNGLIPLSDGAARFAPAPPASQWLIQPLAPLESGQRYRLTARVRTEGIGSGSAMLALLSYTQAHQPVAYVTTQDTRWTTLSVEAMVDGLNATFPLVAIGLSPDAPAGAVVWCDDVSLTRIDSPT